MNSWDPGYNHVFLKMNLIGTTIFFLAILFGVYHVSIFRWGGSNFIEIILLESQEPRLSASHLRRGTPVQLAKGGFLRRVGGGLSLGCSWCGESAQDQVQ